MSHQTTEPLDKNTVWPPAPDSSAIVFQTPAKTLLDGAFSRLVGFGIALALQPVWFLLLPQRTPHPHWFAAADFYNDATDPIHYWIGLGIVTAMATVGICWSIWDIYRTWQRLRKMGEVTDSAKFLLSFVGILLNCVGVVAYDSTWTMRLA